MKTIEFPEFKDYIDQNVHFLQPKRDGHLCKIYKSRDYEILHAHIQAFSKNDKDITHKLLAIKHIRIELTGLPCNSIIFAEMHCPGRFATDVPTMLNDADENLQLTVFAAPLLSGVDLAERNLISVMERLNSFGLNVSCTTLVKHDFINLAAQEILLNQAAEKKLEGWVLKEGHMTGWYKLKPVKTVDAFVIDTYASDSKRYKGGLKCIRIAVWDKEGEIRDLGTAGNGFKLPYRLRFVPKEKMDILLGIDWLETDERNFQEHLTVACLAGLINRDTLLDKVCEITYDSVAAGGKLRFPRFSRWRDDKDIENCTEEQLK